MIRAVIFDLDGTILDTSPVWEKCDEQFLNERGIPLTPEITKNVQVLSIEEAGEYLADLSPLDETPQDVVEYIMNTVRDGYKYHAPLKELAFEFIEKLRDNEIAVCVATATDYELAKMALERVDIIKHIDFILTCDNVGESKTSPKIFDVATEKLGLKKHEVVIFEDSLHSIETAKNAGYKVVGVYDELSARGDAQEQMKLICDKYIENFAELLYRSFP